MEYVTNLPRNLLFLFAIIAILVIGYKLIIYYAEHQPIYDPLVHGPEDQQEIAAKHVSQRASSQLIGGLLQLDEEPAPLPSRPITSWAAAGMRAPHPRDDMRAEAEMQRQMAADTIKGKRS